MSIRVDQYYILASSGVIISCGGSMHALNAFRTPVTFYYDFILTIPQEIKHIWSAKFKSVNVLIIALRYISAIGYIPILTFTFAPLFSSDSVTDKKVS